MKKQDVRDLCNGIGYIFVLPWLYIDTLSDMLFYNLTVDTLMIIRTIFLATFFIILNMPKDTK